MSEIFVGVVLLVEVGGFDLSEQMVFSPETLLSGKVDVEALQSRYIFVMTSGFSQKKVAAKLGSALNYLAKYGWRAVSYADGVCLVEKVE